MLKGLLRSFIGDLASLLPASFWGGKGEDFSSELEQRYQQFIGPEKIRTIRLACALANLVTVPFAILDIWALPETYLTAWMMRSGCFAFVVAVYLSTRKPAFLDRYTTIGVVLFAVLGLMIIGLVGISGVNDLARTCYSTGVILIIMGMYSLSFLSVRFTFGISVLFVLSYSAIAFGLRDVGVSGDLAVSINNLMFLSAAAFVGLVSQVGRDQYERKAFLHKHALDSELVATESARRISEHFARHDALTGLPNRKAFEDRLSAMIERFRPGEQDIAVLFIDLDGFKPINDQHGHAFGDKVLFAVGQRINAAITEHDLAARVGGDEFVVALDLGTETAMTPYAAGLLEKSLANSPENSVKLTSERLVTAISQPLAIDGKIVAVGASIGVSLASIHGADPISLLANADRSMYEVKNRGKGAARLARSKDDASEQMVHHRVEPVA